MHAEMTMVAVAPKSCDSHGTDCACSLADLYVVREALQQISSFIDRFPFIKAEDRDEHCLFLIKQVQALKTKLMQLSQDAFMESVHLSVNLIGYQNGEEENYAVMAKKNLNRISDLMCLDDLFDDVTPIKAPRS